MRQAAEDSMTENRRSRRQTVFSIYRAGKEMRDEVYGMGTWRKPTARATPGLPRTVNYPGKFLLRRRLKLV